MKQEAGKKKWLLPVIIGLVVVLIAAAVGAIFLLQDNDKGDTNKDAGASKVSSEIYWNVDRQTYLDSTTGLSIREPGEDGAYHIRFAVNGEQKEFICSDKKLVNRIDMLDYMGLQLDSDGNILDAIGVANFATLAADGFYVQKVEDGKVTINSSAALNGMSMDLAITDATGIFDVSTTDENCGKPTTPDVMDRVIVIQNADATETTHIFINERPVDAEVYWRVDLYWGQNDVYNTNTKTTKRIPDENGVYTLLMACNGQQVEVKCKDLEIVNKIDSASINGQGIGLVMDEEGYAVQWTTPAKAVRGTEQANQWDITAVNGDTIDLMRKLPGSTMGATDSFKLAPGCHIYDTTECSGFVGIEIEASQLQVGDRVYMLCNAEREVVQIWITNRIVDVPMYYLLNRSFNTTLNETGLVPDENGWYNLLVSKDGKQLNLKTKDKFLASQITKPGFYGMGLRVDGSIVKEYFHYTRVTGGWINGGGSLVTSVAGPVLATEASNGTTYNMVLAANCKIYNCDANSAKLQGEKTTLKKFDKVYPIRNAEGEITHVYITQRYQEGTVYYNPTRKYNSTLKETTRVPDAEGYYVFEGMTTGGKKGVTLKTKDKNVANAIDADTLNIVGLQVKGDIIMKATTGSAVVKYGAALANNCHMMYWSTEGESFYYEYLASGNGGSTKIDDRTEIYNVSTTYKNYLGEKTTLQVGDQIRAISGQGGYCKYIYVVARETKGSLYYLLKNYGKDENGVYKYDYLKDGKIVTLQTTDPAVNSQVGSYTVGCGIVTEGTTIKRFFPAASLADYGAMAGGNYDVVKISGNQITVKRNRPGASDDGNEITLTKAAGCKIYDTSVYGNTAKQVKLKVGDRVVCYQEQDSKDIKVIFVTNPNTHEGGPNTVCQHCGKKVFWIPVGSHSSISGAGHYYLTNSYSTSSILISPGANSRVGEANAWEVVVDLNGKTLTGTSTGSRLVNVLFDSKLVLMDNSKAKTGGMVAVGNGVDGGCLALVHYGGDLTILGGTYSMDASKAPSAGSNGLFMLTNGPANVPALDANGQIVKDAAGNTVMEKRQLTDVSLTIKNATINGGVLSNGGAISAYQGALTLENCVINEGTVTGSGDSLLISTAVNAKIKDCTINGGVLFSGGELAISGKTVINKGKNMGISIGSGLQADLTGLVAGSKLNVTASGVFTTEFKDEAAAQKAATYIVGGYEGQTAKAEGKAVTMTAVQRCLFGHTEAKHAQLAAAGTPCAEGLIDWYPTSSIPKADGAYFLTKNVTTADRTEIVGKNTILDLNGFDIVYNVPAPRNSNSMNSTIRVSNSGAKQGVLYIVDNSTTDPAQQGSIKTVVPPFVPNDANITAWQASAETTAKNQIDAAAKEAALLKGEEGSDAYKAEYEAQLKALTETKFEELKQAAYDATYNASKIGHDRGGYGMCIYVNKGAQVNLLSGHLDSSHNTTGWNGGAVYVDTDGCFNMVGGTVSGAMMNYKAAHGSAIYNKNGIVTITGGTVIGGEVGEASNGGAIYNDQEVVKEGDTSVTVNKAVTTIGGNAVIKAGKAPNGDTMYVRFGKLIVKDNAVINGGIHVRTGLMEISGNPKIVKDENGSAYSLKISSGTVTFNELGNEAKIGITCDAAQLSTAGDGAALQAYLDKGILYAEDGKNMIVMNNTLYAPERVGCVNGHTNHNGIECSEPIVVWEKLPATTTNLPSTAGYYYLEPSENPYVVYQNALATEAVNIVIDLNGQTLKTATEAARIYLVYKGSNVTIMNGTMVAGFNTTTAENGGLLYVNNGSLTLKNVTVDASPITTNTFNGAAMHILAAGTVTIENSTIIGGAAVSGGAIYKANNSTLTIKDSVVQGEVYNVASGLKTFLKGTTQLLPGTGAFGFKGSIQAASFDLSGLTEGAKIVVANCNYNFADAAAAQAAVDNGLIVAAEGSTLTVNGSKVTATIG